jgi:hypothetical protein
MDSFHHFDWYNVFKDNAVNNLYVWDNHLWLLIVFPLRTLSKVFFYAKTCFREVQAIDKLKIKRMHINIYKIVTAPFGT